MDNGCYGYIRIVFIRSFILFVFPTLIATCSTPFLQLVASHAVYTAWLSSLLAVLL